MTKTLAVGAVMLALTTTAWTARSAPRLTLRQWAEDVTFFARELPRRHEDLHHTLSTHDFATAVTALADRLSSLQPHQVMVELARITAAVGDGHTELQLLQPATGFRVLPVTFYAYEDGLFIGAAEEHLRDMVGGKVLTIGAVAADEAMSHVAPLVSGDTVVEHRHAGPTYLGSPQILHALDIISSPESVPLVVRARDGQERRVTLDGVDPAARRTMATVRSIAGVPPPLFASRPERYYWFAPVPGTSAMFFQLNASMNQDGQPGIDSIVGDMFAAFDRDKREVLVVDVRNNNGGNIARNRALLEGIRSRPGLDAKGRLFIVTGRRTFSAGLDFVLEAQKLAAPILVGEPSRGLPAKPGNRETFTLPHSKLVVDYSERIDSLAFRAREHRPLAVDVAAPPTIEAALQGRDPALDAILAQLAKR